MFVVIDLGGTRTRVMTCESPDHPSFTPLAAYPTPTLYSEQRQHLLHLLETLGRDRLQGVALAVGAQLTRDGLAIDKTYTMPDYAGKPLIADLSEALPCPVQAANDNVCAVLAEMAFGSLKGEERAAYLTVSTGTGAGICLRQADQGIAFLAQVGHHMIDARSDLRCVCGQVGCVQTITGGQQIAERFGRPAAEIVDEAFWQEMTDTLAVAVVNLARIARIDAVAVGGGIGFNNTYLRAHLAEQVQAAGPSISVRVIAPHFGEAAPLHGAALLLQGGSSVTILH